jgi:hypothetical protein
MKNLFVKLRKRLVLLAGLLVILQILAIYLYNFQSEMPLFSTLVKIYSCFGLFLFFAIPFLFTRRVFMTHEDNLPQGWKIGLLINAGLVVFFVLFSILDLLVKLSISGLPVVAGTFGVLILTNLFGMFLALIVGMFAGWLGEITVTRK